MRSKATFLTGIAFLTSFVAITPVNAAISVYHIEGVVDSLWMTSGPTQYHGTTPFPAKDVFTGGYLSGTWNGDGTSDVVAPGGSGVSIGTSLAHGNGSYSGTISNSSFSFDGSVFAETELDLSSGQTQIAAEGAASMVTYFVVPAGPGVTMTSSGTITSSSWWPTAEYRISQVFPSAPSTTIVSKRSGSWSDAPIVLAPGTYRADYFLTTTYYPSYPSGFGASYVYSDDWYPEYFSASGTMTVSTNFIPVPEPTIGFAAAVVTSSVLLRPRRRVAATANIGGRDE